MLDRRLFRLAPASRNPVALIILLGVLLGIVTVLQAFLLARIIARVFLDHQTLPQVASLLGALLAALSLRAALTWGFEGVSGRLAIRIKTDLRERLFHHLIALGPSFAERERTGELVSTSLDGVEALETYFSQYVPQLVLAALVPLTLLAFVTPFDSLSALILLLTAPLIPFFMILIGNLADSITRRRWALLGRTSAHFLDVLQGLTTLKILNASRAQVQVIAEMSRRFGDLSLGTLRVAFVSSLVLEWVATLSTAIIAVEIGLRLLSGGFTFEPALFILILAPEFYQPLRLLGSRFHASVAGVTAAQRILQLLDSRPARSGRLQAATVASLVHGSATAHPTTRPLLQIRFDGVSVEYDPNRQPALQEITFTIEAGKTVAVVGPTGAGKSTLAKLLLRFVEPSEGKILVDGTPLAELPAGAWRARVGWVPQRPYLFHGSLAANLRIARPGATLKELEFAAERAHLDEVIRVMPQGLGTVIGEGGARLSGGQAQRLALARALLKDAPLLVLDEPTSSVDPDLEARLLESSRELMRGRTVLLIAHRLATVYDSNLILVLEAGRLVESGTHQTLLEGQGLYRRMVLGLGEQR